MKLNEYYERSAELSGEFNGITKEMDALRAKGNGEIDSVESKEFRNLWIKQDNLIKKLEKLARDAGFVN